MNIHQISVTYVQAQDRCLVRINSHAGEELRLWFTRRLTLGLMPRLKHAAGGQLRLHLALATSNTSATSATSALPMAQRRNDLLASFQKEAEIYQGDFKTPFKEQPAALPLGAQPLVITDVKLALQPNGKVDLQLIERSDQQVLNLTLAMDPQLVQGLLHLLAEALKKSQWQQVPLLSPEQATATSDEPMAPLQDVDRPRYLN